MCFVIVTACGDDSSMSDGGPDASSPDDGGFDATVDSAIDSSAVDSGVAPDASGSDGSPRDGGGGGGCGSDPIVSGWDVPRSCMNDAECFSHPACEEADRIAAGYGDYTPCGTMPITPASSSEACMMEPPFGPWPESPPYECGAVQYEGSVSFYCNADGTSVAARFVATHTDTRNFTDYYGHEYWAGSGGGSGDSRTSSTPIDPTTSRFFGWQAVALEPETSTQLQVWFMTGSFIDPAIGRAYTGGFSATVPPTD